MSEVFLVDDHALLRDSLRAVFEDAGHAVVGDAATPEAALEGIDRTHPDVVVLDLQLGRRSGFDVLGGLQREGRDVPVLVLSMRSQPADVAEALRRGARGYVLKASSEGQPRRGGGIGLSVRAAPAARRR